MTHLVWTPEARARVTVRRSHGRREPLPTGAAARAQVAAIYKPRRAAIAAGVAHAAPEQREQQARAIAYLDHQGAPHAVSAAAGAILVQSHLPTDLGPTNDQLSRAIVDMWLAEGGAAFAVLACASTTAFAARRGPRDESLVLVSLRNAGNASPFSGDTLHVERRWRALRERLATMPDADYALARRAAEALLAKASPRLALRLVHAFPDEGPWSAALARTLIDLNQYEALTVVLGSLSDAALIEEVVRLFERSNALALSSSVFDIADVLDDRAAPALLGIADSVIHQQWGFEDERRDVLGVLALLPSPAVASWFANNLGERGVRSVAAPYFKKHPALADAALRPLAEGRRPNEVAMALLRASERTGKAFEAAEEATASELPPVLAAPPWAAGAKRTPKKKRVALALTPLAFAETLLPGDEDVAEPGPGSSSRRAALEANIRAGRTQYLWALLQLTSADAREVFLGAPIETWVDAYVPMGPYLDLLLSRIGLMAIPRILEFPKKKYGDVAEGLERAVSPRVAPVMAHVLARVKKVRRVAERWLTAHPRAAAIQLLVELTGRDRPARENAARALRFLATRGKREVLAAVASEYGKASEQALADALTTDSLDEGAPAKPPKLPTWLDLQSLPRPVLRGTTRALPLSALQALVEMLAFTDSEEPYEGLEHVRQACDAASLGELAWAIFEEWATADYPPDEKWAFFAVGHLGTDAHAHRIAQLVRAWPSEGAFPRAVVGLDVLATMKSDTSFMLLHGISEKVKSRPLLQRAREKMESVAESLGLGTEELGDRLVPTLGLDDDGSRLLDFGPRRFRVGFDEYLRPFVRDDHGKKLSELPKAGASDDPEKAQAATAEWKAIKKHAKAAAAAQLVRLENAMIAQRRWEPGTFATYIVRHPLVGHLARRLAFAAYDPDGKLVTPFRVAEDGTYADEDDETFTVPDGASIGVLHPLEVAPAALDKLGQRFSEYEVLQPFPQVGREVPRGITDVDPKGFVPVETLKLLALERRGWRRGQVGDGGMVSTLEKEVGTLRASLHLEPGIYAGDPAANPSQTPAQLDISDARTKRRAGAPPPIFLAEVTADLRGVGALTSPP